MGLFDSPPARPAVVWRRWLGFAGAADVLTAALVALALFLGAWAFETRSLRLHQERLARLLEKSPRLEQVVEGLEAEGAVRLGSPRGAEQLQQQAARAATSAEEVMAKGRRWPVVRVFQVGDVVYFLFFDQSGILRDFAFGPRKTD
jgi:hypothetical protein